MPLIGFVENSSLSTDARSGLAVLAFPVDDRQMVIRYYAYAYEAKDLDLVMADAGMVISSDPLADAWGFEPHAYGVITPTFEQSVPESEMLYLDKAWSMLQYATGPADGWPARPAYRMFEGRVTETGMGHLPFERVITPAEVVAIAADLAEIRDDEIVDRVSQWHFFRDDDPQFALQYFRKARAFMANLAAGGRGMAYTIR